MYKYGLLTYHTVNIGDDVQSLAAKQYLPKVDYLWNRDFIASMDPKERTKIILNGWFKENPTDWPIRSNNILPLFVSFHISNQWGSSYEPMINPKAVEYYKKHEPIGCRDLVTMNMLRDKGVDAYFSGCLTLTLQNKWQEARTDEIIFIDVPKNYLEMVPPEIKKKAIFIKHEFRFSFNREKKAEKLLRRYAKAKLIVTSRLHAALPSIAFKTPVLFANTNKADPRFSGFENILPFITPEDLKKYAWDNPTFHNPDVTNIVDHLQKRCKEFIAKQD